MEAKLDTLQRNEISEGVEIRLRVAGAPIRALAWLIDFWFEVAGAFLILMTLGGFGLLFPEFLSGIVNLVFFGLIWVYHLAFEASKLGATPGKLILGLKVVQLSGARINFRQAGMRNLLRFVDSMPIWILPIEVDGQPVFAFPFLTHVVGVIFCMATSRSQRLGDLFAGTVVIYKDQAINPVLQRMPPLAAGQLPPYAPATPMTREEQEAVVKFADRATEWNPSRQIELADHAQPLTKAAGPAGVQRLLGIAKWIRRSG